MTLTLFLIGLIAATLACGYTVDLRHFGRVVL